MKIAIASQVSDYNPATATTTGLRVDPFWREQAACLSVDPELFFPDFSHEAQTPAEVEAMQEEEYIYIYIYIYILMYVCI